MKSLPAHKWFLTFCILHIGHSRSPICPELSFSTSFPMRRCFEFSVIKNKAAQVNLEQDSAIAEIVGVPVSWFWCCALGSNTGHGPYLRLFKGNRYNTIKKVWVLELRFARFYKKYHWGNRKTGVYGTTSIQHGVRDWGADTKRPRP